MWYHPLTEEGKGRPSWGMTQDASILYDYLPSLTIPITSRDKFLFANPLTLNGKYDRSDGSMLLPGILIHRQATKEGLVVFSPRYKPVVTWLQAWD